MVRLRRTSPDQPGWTRRRAGTGFVYLDERRRPAGRRGRRSGARPGDPAGLAGRVDRAVPNGHLQAVGTDDAGRRQYLYHPAWRERRDAEKLDRVLLSAGAVPGARAGARRPRPEGMTLERACAAAVRLLDLGYFRIGNDVYADETAPSG